MNKHLGSTIKTNLRAYYFSSDTKELHASDNLYLTTCQVQYANMYDSCADYTVQELFYVNAAGGFEGVSTTNMVAIIADGTPLIEAFKTLNCGIEEYKEKNDANL